MTEEQRDALPEGAAEEQERPTPVVSSGLPAVGSEGPGLDSATLVTDISAQVMAGITEALPELIDRRFKSAKDKRFAKVEEILDAVKEAGGDPSKIEGRLRDQDLYSRLDSIEALLSSEAGGAALDLGGQEQRFPIAKAEKILNDAGGSWDDPAVKAWSESQFSSDAQAEIALKAALSKQAKQAGITSAATVGSPGVSAPAILSDDMGELAAELSEIQGGKNPFSAENIKRADEIVAKLNELDPPMNIQDDDQFYAARSRGRIRGTWFSDEYQAGLPFAEEE